MGEKKKYWRRAYTTTLFLSFSLEVLEQKEKEKVLGEQYVGGRRRSLVGIVVVERQIRKEDFLGPAAP